MRPGLPRMGEHARRLARTIRRVPFTVGALVAIIACALLSGSYRESVIGSPLLGQVGYGLSALREGRAWSFVAGMLFAPEPWMYLTIAAVLVAFVGPYEYLVGTPRAAGLLVLTQLGGALLAALLVGALSPTGWGQMVRWAATLDAGASAGIFGAGAALTSLFPRPWRNRARAALFAYLLAMLALSARYWDLEHLLSACLGLLAGPVLVRRARQGPVRSAGRDRRRPPPIDAGTAPRRPAKWAIAPEGTDARRP